MGEDADPVADAQHLPQLMADENDALSLRRHLPDHFKQRLALLRQQHGGWLVQNQDFRTGVQKLQNLDFLLHADAQPLHGAVQLHLNVVLFLQLFKLRAHLFPVPYGQRSRPVHQAHVLHRVKPAHQHEMLVHHADTVAHGVLGAGNFYLLAAQQDAARVGMIHSENNIHQGAFPRAVFAQQGQHLSPV
ncbi:hypothetical protein SDC9_106382 [bioreactor metagenome]|uniref:Uncharacterized protein n=1 Tax=bioreactor metagenome TaxID=1076179 RepID=A0A645B394_9ZZZZ